MALLQKLKRQANKKRKLQKNKTQFFRDKYLNKNNKMELIFNNKPLATLQNKAQLCAVINDLFEPSTFYLLSNGKRVLIDEIGASCRVHVIPRLLGGKGGFGSMLRAIGAQIEKTTNREACRDLSGRRLRDINEEQRLKNWIQSQGDREKDAADKKQKKLEKLCEEPKHVFKDESYEQTRAELTESVEDAVLQGLKAAPKRKSDSKPKPEAKKKRKRFFDDELSCSSSSGSESDDMDAEPSKTEEIIQPIKQTQVVEVEKV